ncbi:hypothetical protein D9757_009336 [Collybiopsis confluens]|uniref:GTP-binding protein n=1 Tax=Collybiopsis confluens TaxID=2823264 RepID=A0A8H5H3M0_9AGAR|nr:hypothetical protein D9757_009336 [Collybiopsis confluens]
MSSSDGVARTKILLLGLRRSGKTSIQKVIFNGMVPKETFFLDATMRIVKHTYDSVIPLEIWDCPGNITVETLGTPLSAFSTLVFVIDIRDLYNQPISRLVDFIVASYRQNPSINFEILVHKAEKLNDDDKIENFRQINERVMDRLYDVAESVGPLTAGSDSGVNFMEYVEQQMTINFHLTSIFDHSLHQAFSIVLQKLIDSLPYIEDLLNIYCANSQASKAFLFDAQSRLYVATDASPVDSVTHNLCTDNLAMLNAFEGLYRSSSASPARRRRGNPELQSSSYTPPDVPATPPPSAVNTNGTFPLGLPQSPSSSASSSRTRSPSSKTPQTLGLTVNDHPPSSSSSSSLFLPSYPDNNNHPPSSTIPHPESKHHLETNVVPVSSSTRSNCVQTPQDLFYPSGATSIHPSALPSSTYSTAGSTGGSTGSGIPAQGTTIMWHLLTAPRLAVEDLRLELEGTSEKEKGKYLERGLTTAAVNGSSPPFQTYPNPTLILLVLLPTSVFESRRGLVELNVVAVREGVQEIVDVERESRGTWK